jgi:hypothetical protein
MDAPELVSSHGPTEAEPDVLQRDGVSECAWILSNVYETTVLGVQQRDPSYDV